MGVEDYLDACDYARAKLNDATCMEVTEFVQRAMCCELSGRGYRVVGPADFRIGIQAAVRVFSAEYCEKKQDPVV